MSWQVVGDHVSLVVNDTVLVEAHPIEKGLYVLVIPLLRVREGVRLLEGQTLEAVVRERVMPELRATYDLLAALFNEP